MSELKRPDFPAICTVQFITSYLTFMSEICDDDERAHIAEDCLYEYVLNSIADGTCKEIKKCSREALKTEHLDFNRNYHEEKHDRHYL